MFAKTIARIWGAVAAAVKGHQEQRGSVTCDGEQSDKSGGGQSVVRSAWALGSKGVMTVHLS